MEWLQEEAKLLQSATDMLEPLEYFSQTTCEAAWIDAFKKMGKADKPTIVATAYTQARIFRVMLNHWKRATSESNEDEMFDDDELAANINIEPGETPTPEQKKKKCTIPFLQHLCLTTPRKRNSQKSDPASYRNPPAKEDAKTN